MLTEGKHLAENSSHISARYNVMLTEGKHLAENSSQISSRHEAFDGYSIEMFHSAQHDNAIQRQAP